MIVVDTNVLSELMRPDAEVLVVAWVDAQARHTLATTSVTHAELLYGVELLENGKRKANLAQVVAAIVASFEDRVFPFDAAAAQHYALIVAGRRRLGRPILPLDAQIAAIAASRNAAIASRDRDLLDCGVDIINPWRERLE